jgi:S1-C subfamily serine protease
LAFGRVRRQIAQETSATDVPNSGIIIAGAEGAAAKAGIGTWDILLSIDGQKTESLFDLNRVLVPKKPGDVVTIKVWSKGQEKTIKIALQELRRDV